MSFNEYLQKEISYIEQYSRFQNIPIDQACTLWVEKGFAELFAVQYRSKLLTEETQKES